MQRELYSSITQYHHLSHFRIPCKVLETSSAPTSDHAKDTPSFAQLRRNPATMSSGQVLKAEKDFTKEADKVIPEAEKLGTVCANYER